MQRPSIPFSALVNKNVMKVCRVPLARDLLSKQPPAWSILKVPFRVMSIGAINGFSMFDESNWNHCSPHGRGLNVSQSRQ